MHPELNMQAANDRHRHLLEPVPLEADADTPETLVDDALARLELDEDERRGP